MFMCVCNQMYRLTFFHLCWLLLFFPPFFLQSSFSKIGGVVSLKHKMSLHPPMLLFPGLGASRLIQRIANNTDNFYPLWPPTITDFVFSREKWLNTMTIRFDENINVFIGDPDISTLEFGNKNAFNIHSQLFPSFITKNLYTNIIDAFPNMHPIPYDFRRIHDNQYIEHWNNLLTEYIETQFKQPIIMVSHSSGGLLSHHFLCTKTDEWKQKHVKKVVNIGVPFGGLLVPLKEIVMKTKLNWLFGKEMLSSVGALIINMPNIISNETADNESINTILFPLCGSAVSPTLEVDGQEIDDYYAFFHLETLKKFKKNSVIVPSFTQGHGVSTTVIYSSNKKTPVSIIIDNQICKIKYGLGDGTVPIESLLVPQKWKQQYVDFLPFNEFEHSTILFSHKLKDYLMSL